MRALLAWLTGVAALLSVGLVALPPSAAPASATAPAPDCGAAWVGAWRTSPQPGPGADVAGRTLRMIAVPQATGTELRIRVSNRFGASPLQVGSASVGLVGAGADLVPGSGRPVTFDGAPGVVVPPGAEWASDPVTFVAERGRAVAVSLFVPTAPALVSVHPVALTTSYVSEPGSVVDDPSGATFTRPVTSWSVLSGLDVLTPRTEHAVVLVGDSITDGVGATAGTRWSDALAERLTGALTMPVLNAGISANQLVAGVSGPPPAQRYATDVADVPGATDVVLHIGTNDLAAGRSAAEVTAGLAGYADRARADGHRVFLTTITPSDAGAHGLATAQRDAVNRWVRTEGAAHADGVFDFAAAVADPSDPTRLAAAYDSGDGLHLSPAGYRALAGAVDVGRLTGSPCLADDAAQVRASAAR
ncbi:GDSL-type esterase/lipase family protein [Pseudonocardia sp. WMMC193]|uniref:GDSL-type esterase/lipase family protein n=1 Tax=Pseudonocardia sp. WMMC193 TaxID=2911965 RepID=UPI001F47803F|nr:GDSL-type esterase/lipase family protein [Pseudonocardia sp. WMMC193]MCF7551488.1 GDSL-type esterase/lipase family protein [Pseudonocardia sp. WMMC193]